ncbi:TPA: ribulose-bisphosphate carboxylase large subunit, partial [Candidatus Micrarchaeota archaeon]|nr:ribulose-bisphosphate carboxylase large subunit [Candidatus Micrarchaeota archaeon]
MRSAEGFEWYLDFVDKGYAASEDEVVAVFRVTPAEGVSVESAAGRVASESSIGTWTTLTTMSEDLRRLMARAYEFADLGDGSYLVKVAYPVELFEEGNLSQLVSSVMGNVFGMKALKGLRVEDVYLPRSYVESFRGPGKGIPGVRELLKVRGRPVLATVPKPKVGLDVERYAEVAREVLAGGVDLLKDDENLTNQRFNRFEERVKRVVRVIDEVEKETGESKGYLANVTAEVKEMERRIKLVADVGNPFIMVDFVIVGWSALQTVRDAAEDYGLAIHAHRAFHAAFTRSSAHGASMFVLAKLARLVGVDHLHVGT